MARIFITGSTDMRGAKQAQYQTQLKQILDNCIARGDTVITGDQPGIESIAQAYLNSKRYGQVQIKHLNKTHVNLPTKTGSASVYIHHPSLRTGTQCIICVEDITITDTPLSIMNIPTKGSISVTATSSNVLTVCVSSGTGTLRTAR